MTRLEAIARALEEIADEFNNSTRTNKDNALLVLELLEDDGYTVEPMEWRKAAQR